MQGGVKQAPDDSGLVGVARSFPEEEHCDRLGEETGMGAVDDMLGMADAEAEVDFVAVDAVAVAAAEDDIEFAAEVATSIDFEEEAVVVCSRTAAEEVAAQLRASTVR